MRQRGAQFQCLCTARTASAVAQHDLIALHKKNAATRGPRLPRRGRGGRGAGPPPWRPYPRPCDSLSDATQLTRARGATVRSLAPQVFVPPSAAAAGRCLAAPHVPPAPASRPRSHARDCARPPHPLPTDDRPPALPAGWPTSSTMRQHR
ncbi:Protein of unknown function [Gryllus bimaculatus]|nr:Protein of unknown function [Gryllus bimaculatus]